MNKWAKKFVAGILATAMILSVYTPGYVKGAGEENLGTVTFDIERMTIGQGFYMEPVKVEIKAGDNVKTIFKRALKDMGGTYTAIGVKTFYLKTINNADAGTVNIPKEISAMPDYSYTYVGSDGEEHSVSYKAPTSSVNIGNQLENNALGEYSYGEMAGWMFTINNEPASESVNYIPVKDGDVIRLQFSVYGYGADLGYDTESYTGIPKLQMANRDALLKEVAETNEKKDYWMAYPNVKSAYDKAFQVAKEYNPTQKNVDNALAALQGTKKKPTYPTVKTASIKTVKNVRKYKAKIYVNQASGATGYQYKYSVSKSFKKAVVKTTSKTYITTKKLKKKQVCYVKVRGYRVVNGVRIYGKWSKVKTVRIKK